MTTHTPGPWVWRSKSGSLHQVGTAPYAYGNVVLEPSYDYDSGTDTKVSDADAALIAAAPELLDALKALLKKHEPHHNSIEHAATRALIARAEAAA